MTILFLISVHGHGRGGHFHSLNHISRKIGEMNDVKIISFGPVKSEIIASNPHFDGHIIFNGFNIIHLKNELKKITKKLKPEIYHFFDISGYNTMRLFISPKKNKIIVNKCGGANPIQYPYIPNVILFSNENFNWFKNQKKYDNSNINLIPNRVKSLLTDTTFKPIKKVPGEFVFLRICRIGSAYMKSITDSILLIEKLLSKNLNNVKLYIIGTAEDKNIFKKLNDNPLVQNGRVIFLTESAYTTEASKMLYLADAVIGTGRGLMEAASLAIPLLTINKNGNVPALLNHENFLDAFNTNFSERNVFPNLNNEDNLKKIINLVQKKTYYDEMSKYSKEVYDEYFNLDKVSLAYPDAYAAAIFGEKKLLRDSSFIIRSYMKFIRSYLKMN